MLVLSRKRNESIMIGDDIEIKVIAVEGDLVRIGIEAPRNVEVFRKEIYEAIQDENRSAVISKARLGGIQELYSKLNKHQNKD